MWKARLDNTFWVHSNSLFIRKSSHHCINKQMLHIFQHLREQGEIENRICCITSQEASMVQREKTSKCGQKSYFLWKLHYNFPVYIYAVLDLVAARRNLKKHISQNSASKFLFSLQPAWIDVLTGCSFSFPEDNTTALQEMVLDFCLPGVCFLLLSEHKGMQENSSPGMESHSPTRLEIIWPEQTAVVLEDLPLSAPVC